MTTGAPDTGFGDAVLGPGTKLLGTGGLNGSNLGALVASVRKDGDIFLAWDNLDVASTKNGSMELTPAGQLRTTYGAGGTGRNAIALTTGIAVRNDGGPSDGNLAMLFVNTGTVTFQQISPITGGYDPLVGGQKTLFLAGAKRSNAGPQGLVVFPDGSIAGAFQAADGVYLLKYTAVGAPSPGFGASGIAGPFASPGEPTGIAVQSDGKLLVSYDTGGLSRFTTTGLRDDDFGDHGDHGSIPAIAPTVQARRSVVVQKNGRILLGGERGTTVIDGSITAYWP